MNHRPKLKYKTIKLLNDNIGENLDVLGYGDAFLDVIPKEWSMRAITDKLDFIKIKNFCSEKDSVKRMNRKAKDWEKIFKKYTPNKRPSSKIYKKNLEIQQ